jgi:DNA-binding LytR/AlgR family response regulator
VKVALTDILYIEGLADYLKIHLPNGKTLLTRMTMKSVLSKLDKEFIRVHRSFIVPFSRIQSVRNKSIQIQGTDKEIPIGVSYEEDFNKSFKQR